MGSEAVARAILQHAGIDELSCEGMGHLAALLFGPDGLDYVMRDDAPPVEVLLGPPRLLLRSNLSRERLTMAIAVGIAVWWQTRGEFLPADMTPASIAMALVVPFDALRDAIDRVGRIPRELAAEFVCPVEIVRARLAALNEGAGSGTHRRIGAAS